MFLPLQGYGTNYYNQEEYYEGEWYADKRSGWGRMHYSDGSVYEGEWYSDQRNGKGILSLVNGNRYEGMWERDMKNGEGKFLYMNKGQVYTGTWVDGMARCGVLEDLGIEDVPSPPAYPLPRVSNSLTLIIKYCMVWSQMSFAGCHGDNSTDMQGPKFGHALV
jgi:hypothetical protein